MADDKLRGLLRLIISAVPFLAAIAYPFVIPWKDHIDVSISGILSWIVRFLEVVFEAFVCLLILSHLPRTVRQYVGTSRRCGWTSVVARSGSYLQALARSATFSPWVPAVILDGTSTDVHAST